MQDKELLKILIEAEDNQKDELLLTAYIPTEHLNTTDVKKIIKSVFMKKNILKNKILNKIEDQIDVIKNCRNGLAIFIKLKYADGIAEIEDGKLWIKTLITTPEQSLELGKTFNLDQLILDEQLCLKSMVFNLNQDKAKIYSFKDDYLELQMEIENPLEMDKGRENVILGETKINQEKVEVARGLTNKLMGVIKQKENDIKKNCECFIIIYSSHFTDLINSFSKSLQHIFSRSMRIILINKNIQNQDELKELINKKIKLQNRREKRIKLKEAKDMYQNFVEGIDKVTEAANMYKIKRLFIKNVTKIKGYSPEILRKVLASNGEIIVFSKNEKVSFSEVAAQLKY